jgi:hypothetical protein
MRDRFSAWEESTPVLKNDKFSEYTRYAEYCLNVVASTRDQELRCAQPEMAAEWLRLSDTVRRPRRLKQMQMGGSGRHGMAALREPYASVCC